MKTTAQQRITRTVHQKCATTTTKELEKGSKAKESRENEREQSGKMAKSENAHTWCVLMMQSVGMNSVEMLKCAIVVLSIIAANLNVEMWLAKSEKYLKT